MTARLSIFIFRCPLAEKFVSLLHKATDFAGPALHFGVGRGHVPREFVIVVGLQGSLGNERANPRVLERLVPHRDLFLEDTQTLARRAEAALEILQVAFL